MAYRQILAARGAILRPNPRADFSSLDEDVLLDRSETASLLAISPLTLKAWRSRGQGPAAVKIGNSLRYRVGDLRRFIDAGRQDAR